MRAARGPLRSVVPKIVVTGGGGGAGTGGPATSSLFESLLALLLSDRLGAKVAEPKERDPALEAYRERIRRDMTSMLEGNGTP